jgi:hypothetical protein
MLTFMRTLLYLCVVYVVDCSHLHAQQYPHILSLRDQASVMDGWLHNRAKTILPRLMQEEGIDMWIIIGREYDEDPVLKTMLPATWLSARRRTILLLTDSRAVASAQATTNDPIERLAVARYDVGRTFKSAWNPTKQPDQWKRLAELIVERNPRRIAINRSTTFAHADGLSSTEYEQFIKALPQALHERIVSAETLAVRWLETRTPEEMTVYPMICRISHDIIHEGLSEAVIQPGITTSGDVEWWFREKVRSLGLQTWFHPSVSIQRPDPDRAEQTPNFSLRPLNETILPGDLIHVDFGITYLGLNTDQQQHAYILKPGESSAPKGLQQALVAGNRLQDILMGSFAVGRTGNDILLRSLAQAKSEGISPMIYTHPIGFHGHAAGPAIGMWDSQGGITGSGDAIMRPQTAYSIELNAESPVPEWGGKKVRIMLEEDAFFDGTTTRFIDGRQTALWLIPRLR